jgi:NADPH-dependent 2,4-dienoyl-CoA reductase/sulfur reductase-like enzyme
MHGEIRAGVDDTAVKSRIESVEGAPHREPNWWRGRRGCGMPRAADDIGAPLLASVEAAQSPPAAAATATAAAAGAAPAAFTLPPAQPPPPLADGTALECAVIGAGPAGLLTACLLAKAGRPVAVFDARERPTEFYGSFPVVLNMRGQAALSALGDDVFSRFSVVGRAVRELHVVPDNKTVARVETHGTCIMRDQAVVRVLLLLLLLVPIDPSSDQSCALHAAAARHSSLLLWKLL